MFSYPMFEFKLRSAIKVHLSQASFNVSYPIFENADLNKKINNIINISNKFTKIYNEQKKYIKYVDGQETLSAIAKKAQTSFLNEFSNNGNNAVTIAKKIDTELKLQPPYAQIAVYQFLLCIGGPVSLNEDEVSIYKSNKYNNYVVPPSNNVRQALIKSTFLLEDSGANVGESKCGCNNKLLKDLLANNI